MKILILFDGMACGALAMQAALRSREFRFVNL
jgi:hypothetical protein